MKIKLIGALCVLSLSVAWSRPTPRTTALTELWAFTGPWDASSDSSLRANASRIDVAVTGWIGLDSNTALPILPSPYADTLHVTRAVRRMAIVTSWHGDRFHPTSVRTLATDAPLRAKAAGAIARHATAMHYTGLVLDFEDLKRDDLAALLRVIRSIADSAHARGVTTIAVAVPAADTAAYPGKPIASVADLVMPMLYDEHWSTSAPGAIASPTWVRATLAVRIAEVGASRVVAAFPTYGYKWKLSAASAAHTPADVVSFEDAQRAVADAHVLLARDAQTETLHATKAGEWAIWVSDAELLAALTRQAQSVGVRRFALWRIGEEDPGIWQALGR